MKIEMGVKKIWTGLERMFGLVWMVFLTHAIFLPGYPVAGQTDTLYLDLEGCIARMLQDNRTLQNAGFDQEIARSVTRQTQRDVLPQFNGSGSFNYFPQVPVLAVDGTALGQPEAGTVTVEAGTTYDVRYGIQVDQMLFNKPHFMAMRGARAGEELAGLFYEKSKQDLVAHVSVLYYNALKLHYQKAVSAQQIRRNERLLTIAKTSRELGLSTRTDVSRLQLNKTRLDYALSQQDARYREQLNELRYHLGIPPGTVFSINHEQEADTATIAGGSGILEVVAPPAADNVELRLARQQVAMAEITHLAARAEYLPKVDAFARYDRQSLVNTFDLMGEDGNWFSVSQIGLQLEVPLFDSFKRRAFRSQRKLEWEKAMNAEAEVLELVSKEIEQALIQYRQAAAAIPTQHQSRELAGEVYALTRQQYEEDLANLSDLLDAETDLVTAHTEYIQAVFDYKIAGVMYAYARGNLLVDQQ